MSEHLPSPELFSRWLAAHASPLTELDPAAPLDDLEPLRDLIDGARVVAIGENAHFIEEFSRVRERILRFLVERCGFGVLAFEAGFAEGLELDLWAGGAGDVGDLERLTGSALPLGADPLLRWVRERNQGAERRVRFAGVDVPEAGGSLSPALLPVAEYLEGVDPELLPLARAAIEIADVFEGRSMAVAAPAWARMGEAEQDTLSATLSRLLLRFRSLEPLYVARSDQTAYDRSLQCLEAACHTDYHLRAMSALYSGGGLAGDASVRELFMAHSVRWHLERLGPDARMVLFAHNAHIQKTPAVFEGHLTALPMGQHLHRALGSAYRAVALTGVGGRTAEMHVEETARFGFEVEEVELPEPEERSIEAAFVAAGVRAGFADLRDLRLAGEDPDHVASSSPDRIRMQSAYADLRLTDAFDGVICLAGTNVGVAVGGTGPGWRRT